MASQQALQVRKLLADQHNPTLDMQGVEFMRAFYEAAVPPPASDIDVVEVLVEGVTCLWYLAPNSKPDRRIVWLHGGALVSCSRATHGNICAHLARGTDASVMLPEYRIAPENPHPAALEDCLTAYEYACIVGPKGPAPAETLALAGDSAGGWLSLAAMLRLRDTGKPLPDAAVLLSPWIDLTQSGSTYNTNAKVDPFLSRDLLAFCAGLYLNETDPTQGEPARPTNGNFEGFPPTLLQTGEREVLLDDTLRAAEQLRKVGVETELKVWPEMFHCWQFFADTVPEARVAIDELSAFLRPRLNREPKPLMREPSGVLCSQGATLA